MVVAFAFYEASFAAFKILPDTVRQLWSKCAVLPENNMLSESKQIPKFAGKLNRLLRGLVYV
ncbi:MAG: hypothetical protein J6568_04965 [Snodgrassella sp.]|nr:hypothetical protein [Snodgrassella sp.]